MRTWTFTVAGSGEFPMDMLRYDRCWPTGGDDVEMAQWDLGGVRSPCLTTVSPTAPTLARWRSYGWRVIDGPRTEGHAT